MGQFDRLCGGNGAFGDLIGEGKGALAILQRNIVGIIGVSYQFHFAKEEPDGMSTTQSNNDDLDYRKISSIFSHPHSIIWLYCGGQSPYVDLNHYIPMPKDKRLCIY